MENPRPISIAALASGLVADIKRLFSQEVRLAQHEMQLELRKVTMTLLYAASKFTFSLSICASSVEINCLQHQTTWSIVLFLETHDSIDDKT